MNRIEQLTLVDLNKLRQFYSPLPNHGLTIGIALQEAIREEYRRYVEEIIILYSMQHRIPEEDKQYMHISQLAYLIDPYNQIELVASLTTIFYNRMKALATMEINKRKETFTYKGVRLTVVTDDILCKAITNRNSVILLASTEDLYTPVFYQRYCEYIDKASLDKIYLTESLYPYSLDKTRFPKAYALMQTKIQNGEV